MVTATFSRKGRWHHFFARLKGLFSVLPFAVSQRVSLEMKEAARKAALELPCDVLVCDGIHMALNVPMDISCRKILDEHNVESTIIGRYFNVTRNPFVKLYVFFEWLKFRKFEERMWKQFDEIHVCSTADKMQVEKRSGHTNVKVVPNGVSVAAPVTQGHPTQTESLYGTYPGNSQRISQGKDTRTQEGSPVSCDMCHVSPSEKQAFRLVYSGLMGWQPNNDAALYFAKKIWPLINKDEGLRMKDENKDEGLRMKDEGVEKTQNVSSSSSSLSFNLNPLSLKFIIVGKDPSLQVQALAQKDPSITVTGFVEDVAPYIQDADVFVVPLRIGSGTRLKILEAMAMSRPVVSTSIGCEGLDVTHGENILIADTPQDFADSVIRLLNDAALRGRISQAGRDLVKEKYDWEKIEALLAGLISN